MVWRRALLLCLVIATVIDARPHAGTGGDLAAILAAGAAASSGASPYDPAWFATWLADQGINATWLAYSPPPFLMVAVPLSWLGHPNAVFVLHYVAHLAALGAGLAAVARWRPYDLDRALVLAASAGVAYTLWVGNVYAGLAGLAAVGMYARSPVARGVAVGFLFAVKPQYATWLGLWLVAGHTRALGWAALTAAVAWAASLWWWGPELLSGWLHLVGQLTFWQSTNASLDTLTAPLGIAHELVGVPIALACAWRVRHGASALAVGRLAVAAALVLSPVSWVGYALLLVPGWLGSGWTRAGMLGWALMCVPARLVYLVDPLGFVFPTAALLLLGAALARIDA